MLFFFSFVLNIQLDTVIRAIADDIVNVKMVLPFKSYKLLLIELFINWKCDLIHSYDFNIRPNRNELTKRKKKRRDSEHMKGRLERMKSWSM